MRTCTCRSPVRSVVDRLRCSACGAWSPSGRPASRERMGRTAEEATSLLPCLAEQYALGTDSVEAP